jgi:hypothetical protein
LLEAVACACMQTALALAATGSVVELATHSRPNTTTMLSLCAWTVVRAGHCLWHALRDGPHSLQTPPAPWMLPAETLQKLLEAAQTPPPPPMARALYQHALSCLPVLTLGLVMQEGALCKHAAGSAHARTTSMLLGAHTLALPACCSRHRTARSGTRRMHATRPCEALDVPALLAPFTSTAPRLRACGCRRAAALCW